MSTELLKAERALAEARSTLAGLQRKHADALSRETQIAHARRRLGYEAHTTGGAARKQLDDLNREGAVLDGEIQSLAAAVEEAATHIEAAEAAVGIAEDRQRARQARVMLAEMRTAGDAAAAALQTFAAKYRRFEEIALALGQLSVGAAAGNVVKVNVGRALRTELGGLGLAPLLLPRERVSLAELVDAWTDRAEAGIRAILGEEPVDEEEAAA